MNFMIDYIQFYLKQKERVLGCRLQTGWGHSIGKGGGQVVYVLLCN